MTNVANFAGACGECGQSRQLFQGLMPRRDAESNQSATVNGSSPQNCVVANDGGAVFEIMLQPIAGIYKFQIRVFAQGPSGAFSGSMYLAFQDLTGDVYYLSVNSSSQEWHEVSYNSDFPPSKQFFGATTGSLPAKALDADRPKLRYKVQSLVEAAKLAEGRQISGGPAPGALGL